MRRRIQGFSLTINMQLHHLSLKMAPSSSAILAIFTLTHLSISSATPPLLSIHGTFLQCLRMYSPSIPLSIHYPNTSSYTSLLQSSLKNLRFNASLDAIPLLIITPKSESEIQASVVCCMNHGLQVRVLSGGHDYEGLSYRSETPFLIVDLIHCRSISIDLEKKTAWVQAGATLGEVYKRIAEETSSFGFPAGVCPTVGVGGHISGGGFGTISRKFGLAADNIIDAYFIGVNGRILNRETMGENLFWAIRGGGGGNFGIILSWKIKLVPVPPTVTVFTIPKTLEEDATKLVWRWQFVADKLHENLFIRIIAQTVSSKEKGKRTISILFNSMFLGTIEELLPLMNESFPELGLKSEDCLEMSWIESILYFANYPLGTSIDVLSDRIERDKSYFKAKSDFVREPISEIGLEGIWKRLVKVEIGFVIMEPYGGKMSEISESETPFPHREGNLYNIQYIVKWEEGEARVSRKHMDWIINLYRYMSPFVSKFPRAAYLNYRDLDLGRNQDGNPSYLEARVWGYKYFKINFKRLACVKGEVDKENFFSNQQSIPPLLV